MPTGHPAATQRAATGRTALALILAISLVWPPLPALAQDGVRLPDLGGNTEVLPPDEARAFPNEFRNFMRAQGMLIDDPIIESYFTDMGYELVMHSDGRSREFHFHVLKVPGINAFAAPAGVVALNAGLILAAETEDEVAGVLAHEISHVTQNHLSRGVEAAQNVSVPVMLATLGLVVLGGIAGGMDANTASGLMAAGSGLSQQAQINYTRQNESEADRIGIQLLARAGYNPIGMADFFDTLQRWTRSMGAGPPEYLRTHPLTVSRVAEARERAEKMQRPEHDNEDQQMRFHLVRARLQVEMAEHTDQAVQFFRTRIDSGNGLESANRYGLALALIRARRTSDAEQHVAWLLREYPDHQLFQLLEGDLLIAKNRVDEAVRNHDLLYQAYGGSTLVALAYANALLRSETPENAGRAMEVLQRQLRRNPDDPRVTEMLARAANAAGEPVRAAEAVATNYYQRGGLAQAMEQLERVLKRSDLDYYDRARISARLDQMRNEMLRSERRPTG